MARKRRASEGKTGAGRQAAAAPVPILPQPVQSEAATIPLTVGIGASAGGLEALDDLLSHLPEDTNMAFVVVQHLAARP